MVPVSLFNTAMLVYGVMALATSVLGCVKKSTALMVTGQCFGVATLLFIFFYLSLHS